MFQNLARYIPNRWAVLLFGNKLFKSKPCLFWSVKNATSHRVQLWRYRQLEPAWNSYFLQTFSPKRTPSERWLKKLNEYLYAHIHTAMSFFAHAFLYVVLVQIGNRIFYICSVSLTLQSPLLCTRLLDIFCIYTYLPCPFLPIVSRLII